MNKKVIIPIGLMRLQQVYRSAQNQMEDIEKNSAALDAALEERSSAFVTSRRSGCRWRKKLWNAIQKKWRSNFPSWA